jgi:uncharacterized membrane protein YfcA
MSMTLDQQTILTLAVTFVSAVVHSVAGFGNALIAMPLLAPLLGLKTATPLVALLSGTLNGCLLLRDRKRVEIGAAWRLVAASFAGIPLGLYALKGTWEEPLKVLLGLVILAFAVYALVRPGRLSLPDDRYSFAAGFVAGVLGGAYNTNGPPVVVYGMLRRWGPDPFRATLQGYFLVTGFLIMAGHLAAGLWTGGVLRLFFLSLPGVILAMAAGRVIRRRISPGAFGRAVYVSLIAVAALLLFQTLVSP